MKSLIIYSHPWSGSFNHFVLEKTVRQLKDAGDEVDIIDLHKDQFVPNYTAADLKLFSKGQYADPLADSYSQRLKQADKLVLIFPIWWFGLPAMLKGFFDKVLLKGQAYDEIDHQLKGLLHIKEALILTTGNASKEMLKQLGDPIGTTLATGILGVVGIQNVHWIHGKTIHLAESRQEYLSEIDNYLSKKSNE
ncbi:NAD(P)H-dependent oxidoreductase [Liquorilactobacillus satsumensis]|uniref:NAD(P)H-dependent oxidoreductase n=1 Tax=Liquorilactobacillus TaxID=2767888 RepID=UPI0021C464EE|nr:NAD(P)H-dependent oxidoreductase [Liquorilactobacillus satsumensis]MCP9328699.1 NAD(P)H-dependent oxidoreductase [Liquorilactobacillus satsumensis]